MHFHSPFSVSSSIYFAMAASLDRLASAQTLALASASSRACFLFGALDLGGRVALEGASDRTVCAAAFFFVLLGFVALGSSLVCLSPCVFFGGLPLGGLSLSVLLGVALRLANRSAPRSSSETWQYSLRPYLWSRPLSEAGTFDLASKMALATGSTSASL